MVLNGTRRIDGSKVDAVVVAAVVVVSKNTEVQLQWQ